MCFLTIVRIATSCRSNAFFEGSEKIVQLFVSMSRETLKPRDLIVLFFFWRLISKVESVCFLNMCAH